MRSSQATYSTAFELMSERGSKPSAMCRCTCAMVCASVWEWDSNALKVEMQLLTVVGTPLHDPLSTRPMILAQQILFGVQRKHSRLYRAAASNDVNDNAVQRRIRIMKLRHTRLRGALCWAGMQAMGPEHTTRDCTEVIDLTMC